jgi:hypothetical protein
VEAKPHDKLANIIAKHNDIQNGCTLSYTMCWWHIEHASQQGPIHNMHVDTIINGVVISIKVMLWKLNPMAT